MSGDGAEAHNNGDPEPALAHDLDEQRIFELRLLHLLRPRPAHVPERAAGRVSGSDVSRRRS